MSAATGLRAELLRLVADERRVSDGESVLDQHAADLTYHPPHRPDVVVFPETVEEVAAVLAHANQARVPVVPFGAGTSLEGHVIPVHGGISLDLSRMERVLEVRPDDLQAVVQAGTPRSRL
ncbi:MAG: FAD-binding oxidoreductase, partial [Gaiellaceae bacterium]